MSCNSTSFEKKDNTIEDKIDSLLMKMTLAEKVGQMNQYNGFWDVTGPVPNNNDDTENKYKHLKSGLVGSMLTVLGADEVRAVQKIVTEETRLGIPLICLCSKLRQNWCAT